MKSIFKKKKKDKKDKESESQREDEDETVDEDDEIKSQKSERSTKSKQQYDNSPESNGKQRNRELTQSVRSTSVDTARSSNYSENSDDSAMSKSSSTSVFNIKARKKKWKLKWKWEEERQKVFEEQERERQHKWEEEDRERQIRWEQLEKDRLLRIQEEEVKKLKQKEEKRIKKKRERDERLKNHRGYLAKQGHVVKNWHTRYFVIRDKEMFYYMFNNEKKLKVKFSKDVLTKKGFLQLDGSVVHVTADLDGMQNCFFVKSGTGKVFHFAAATPQERMEWIEAIELVSGQTWGASNSGSRYGSIDVTETS